MLFRAYSVTYTKVINVAGGGLSNGNAYANIEIEYKDSDMNEISRVFYAEYGKNPCRKLIGMDIEWRRDDTFNVLDRHGRNVDLSGLVDDEEEEEEEEDEEEEDKLAHHRKNVSGTLVSR